MPTLLDYLESEFHTFDETPVSEVDAAVLSQAAMLNGQGIVSNPPELPKGILGRLSAWLTPHVSPVRFADFAHAERFEGMFTGLVAADIKRCLFALTASPRFRDLEVLYFQRVYDEASHTQFMATAYVWRDSFAFISFAGTDISLVGWRENLDMTYKPHIEAQRLAREFLETIAPLVPNRLFVSGHSKGGNVALYAALTCTDDVRNRIERVWSLDAPGFNATTFRPQDYARLGEKVVRIVPQDSVIGMLLDCPLEPVAVKSVAAGIDQHSIFTWEIEGNGFVRADRLSDMSRAVRDIAAEWLSAMDEAQTERVVDAVCAAIVASGAKDFTDVLAGGQQSWRQLVEASQRIDPASSEILSKAIGDVVNIAVKRVGKDVLASLGLQKDR